MAKNIKQEIPENKKKGKKQIPENKQRKYNLALMTRKHPSRGLKQFMLSKSLHCQLGYLKNRTLCL